MVDFDFDIDFGIEVDSVERDLDKQGYIRTHTERAKTRFDKRRFTSEQALLNNCDWHFRKGWQYHCISQGDVDSLSYLKHILRQQPLDYLLISTWCIGIEDVEELKVWVSRGLIKRLDVYLGEIAKASYARAQEDLEALAESTGGRCGIFRNHSKIMVGYGKRFDFVSLSSANVNTNPRAENTVICCNTSLADFYKEFFDGISPFNGNPTGWRAWKRGD